MSRFIITLLAIIATTSAKPYVVSYAPGYYGGFIAPSYSYNYPYYNYPLTAVTYVETLPVVAAPAAPVAAIPVFPAKLTAKNAAPAQAPPAQAKASAPAPRPASAPAPAGAPAKLITITKTVPQLPDLQGLLSSLPLQQILELPPVKLLAELKTNKLQAISGLQSALQEKLAPIAALLP
ncbi:glutaconyl-CoA decarboxylase subunit gamma-like [Eupeodes corollae]|uniref:glutaconyl-CoA decarboxylase subunit gamma-like n=1 Tax=Eupeodes corollae TaxID=290404 RepID=UPI002491F9E4|nr:glutaconyl-CoA decarboxylase subunit gamma-like [Eupeodes corollae]